MTKLFLRNTTTNGIGATYFDMVTAAGAGSDTAVVNTTADGTEIQFTQTAGGSLIQWVSGRAPSGGFTLTDTDISGWFQESNMSANAGGRYRVFKRTDAGVETELGGGAYSEGVEFGTTISERTWAGDVTDTAFAENDRILLKVYITNAGGTMATGHTCTLTYNAADAATGDSFFNIAETVTFKAEPSTQTLTPLLFTDADTFYSATVSPGAVTLTPSLYTDGDTFYSATVSESASLFPSLFTDEDTFYTATISQVESLFPSLFTDEDTFYSVTATPGAVTLTPALFTDDDTFYSATVPDKSVTLTPSLFNDPDTFYAAAVRYILTFTSDIQKLNSGALVDMFVLDATAIGGSVLRWHNGVNILENDLVWQGETYSRFPIEAEGFEKSGTGTMPRPILRAANVTGLLGALVRELDDLVGSVVTRKRTFVKYLDAVNFDGGINPTADPAAGFPDEIWSVDRKSRENGVFIEFELSAAFDVAGVMLPRRQCVQNVCTWQYRSAECGYSGGPIADKNDAYTDNAQIDACGKRLASCKLRFGQFEPLPFGGFPAVGLIR